MPHELGNKIPTSLPTKEDRWLFDRFSTKAVPQLEDIKAQHWPAT